MLEDVHLREAVEGNVDKGVGLGSKELDPVLSVVPVILGSNGIEQILEISLTDEEQSQLNHSADAVQGLVDDMARLSQHNGG